MPAEKNVHDDHDDPRKKNFVRLSYCKFWIDWLGVNTKFTIWHDHRLKFNAQPDCKHRWGPIWAISKRIFIHRNRHSICLFKLWNEHMFSFYLKCYRTVWLHHIKKIRHIWYCIYLSWPKPPNDAGILTFNGCTHVQKNVRT